MRQNEQVNVFGHDDIPKPADRELVTHKAHRLDKCSAFSRAAEKLQPAMRRYLQEVNMPQLVMAAESIRHVGSMAGTLSIPHPGTGVWGTHREERALRRPRIVHLRFENLGHAESHRGRRMAGTDAAVPATVPSPLRGLPLWGQLRPTAYARGYIPAPLGG